VDTVLIVVGVDIFSRNIHIYHHGHGLIIHILLGCVNGILCRPSSSSSGTSIKIEGYAERWMGTSLGGSMPEYKLSGVCNTNMDTSEAIQRIEPLADDATLTPRSVYIEPMSLDEASELPNLHNLEARIQQTLALTSFGFSASTIAKAWGIGETEVRGIINKYDPERKFQISKATKRAFLTKMLESRAAEALAYITPKKLEEASAADLIGVAERALRSISNMEPRDSTRVLVGSIDDVLRRLSQKPIELTKASDGTYTDSPGKLDSAEPEVSREVTGSDN